MAQAAVSSSRGKAVLLGIAIALALAIYPAQFAQGEEPAPTAATGATGAVSALGADPTVRVARHRHCISKKVVLSPRYTGGGGVTASYLYVNGTRVAKRRSAGSIRVSAGHLARGLNSFELVSEFADGRAASVFGSLRRCGGR